MTKRKPDDAPALPLIEQQPSELENLKPAAQSKPARKGRQRAASAEIIRTEDEGARVVTGGTPPGREVAIIAPPSDLQVMLQTFERLAVNKDVNPDALGKLLDVHERLLDRRAKDAFDAALVAVVPKLPVLAKDGLIDHSGGDRSPAAAKKQKTRFAKWETVNPIIKPILAAQGLVLTHRIETAPDQRVRVRAILRGHGYTDDTSYFDLPADTGGSKNNVQAWASSVSYAKRHTAFASLGMVAREEDDDGRSAGKVLTVGAAMTEDNFAKLVEYREAVGCPAKTLIAYVNKGRPNGHPELAEDGLQHLPDSRFDEAIAFLQRWNLPENRAHREAKRAQQGAQA